MKIYLANKSNQQTGGGFTFLRNYARHSLHVTENYNEADVFMVSGATMVPKEDVEKAKEDGKKIVLRVDNIPRNSRNRNTGTSRLKKFADMADLVIYQSEWARTYIMPFIGKDGPVILNGVDLEVFSPEGTKFPKDGKPQYIYSRFNRDESKQLVRAWYEYQLVHRKNPEAAIWIVGQFSPELVQHNFDFYNGEKVKYWGIMGEEQMAALLRSSDIFVYSYYNDAASNSLIEALCCGVEVWYIEESGGAGEIKRLFEKHGRKYFDAKRMCEEYSKAFRGLFEAPEKKKHGMEREDE